MSKKIYLVIASVARQPSFKRVRQSLFFSCLVSPSIFALPTGGSVAVGSATITNPDSSNVVVDQTSAQAILDWTGFDLSGAETITFNQPTTSSLAINRISGGASSIDGTITANGQVWLLNANGLLFGNSSAVNVGSLVATTGTLNNPASLGLAPLSFTAAGGNVVNQGTISVANDGSVYFIAPTTSNQGTIIAPTVGSGGGRVVLAGATAFTLDPTTSQPLLSLSSTPASSNFVVANITGGTINAGGGNITLLTQGVAGGFSGAVNNSGVLQAQSVASVPGSIILGGVNTTELNLGGTINASGGSTGAGGNIDVVGSFINIAGGLNLDTRGTTAGTATLLGATTTGGTVETHGGNLVQSGNLTLGADTTLATTGGNLTINGTVNGARNLTTQSAGGAQTFNGTVGGSTALSSINTTGGATTLGTVNTTGAQTYTANTLALNGNLTSTAGTLTLNAPTTFAADKTLTAGANIVFNGSLANPARTLNLSAGNDITFANGASLNTLNLTAADDLFLAGTIATNTSQNYTNINDITLTNNAAFTSVADVLFDSGNTLSGNVYNVSFNGSNVVLPLVDNAAHLLATATAITINNTLTTTGGQTFNGPTSLGNNLLTSGGVLQFNSPLMLTNNATLNTAGGNINVASTLDGNHNLTANVGGGTTTFGGVVGGLTPLANLTTTAASNVFVAAHTTTNLTATGTTNAFNGATTTGNLTATGANTFAAPINASGNVVASGANTFTAATTAGGNITLNGPANLGANLTAGGNINQTGASTLTANSTLTSGGGAGQNINLTGNITGPHALNLAAGNGNINFTGNADVSSLGLAASTLNYGGGTLKSANAITLNGLGTVNLGGDTSLIAGSGATRANITASPANTIVATVSGVDLTLFGDTITLYSIGNTGSGILQSLTVDANIARLLAPVFTTGFQTINANEGLAGLLSTTGGDVTLNTNATLVDDVTISTMGGDVFFNRPINGHYNLSINAGNGRVHLNAGLGETVPLASLVFNAADIQLATTIFTTGLQTYNAPIILTGNSTLSSANANLTFNNTIDGPHTLSLITPQSIIANQALGAASPLGQLNVNTTSGDVSFNQAVHTSTYSQTSAGGTTQFNNAGLTADTISIRRPTNLFGNIQGGNAAIAVAGHIAANIHLQNLALKSRSTALTGTLGGAVGKAAARNLKFTEFTGGPHTFGSYALPIVDDFFSPPTMHSTPFEPHLPSPYLNPFEDDKNPLTISQK